MEFMESLYEIENFGIYLFIVIGLLVLAFLITLFFGSKDSKQNKKEKVEEENKDISATESVVDENSKDMEPISTPEVVTFKEESTPVNIEVSKEEPHNEVTFVPFDTKEENISSPLLSEIHEDDIKIPDNISFETPLPEKEEPIKEEVTLDKTFDFDALAAAISKDLDEIEKAVPQKTEEPQAPVTPKPNRPEVFSSVYVNRSKETSSNDDNVVPSMDFDLPKKVELPKTKE